MDRMRHHTLDVSNPESMQLVKSLIDEFMPFLPQSILISVRTKLLIWKKEKVPALAEKKVHSVCIWILSKNCASMW